MIKALLRHDLDRASTLSANPPRIVSARCIVMSSVNAYEPENSLRVSGPEVSQCRFEMAH